MNKNKLITIIALSCAIITTGITVFRSFSIKPEDEIHDIDFELVKAEFKDGIEVYRTENVNGYNEYLTSIAEITDGNVVEKREVFANAVNTLDEAVGRCLEDFSKVQTQTSIDEFEHDNEDYLSLESLDKACADAMAEVVTAVEAYNNYINGTPVQEQPEETAPEESPSATAKTKGKATPKPTKKPESKQDTKPESKPDPTPAPATQKPAAPKQEAPKQDPPKQEAPKQDPPKQEAPKQNPPKQDTNSNSDGRGGGNSNSGGLSGGGNSNSSGGLSGEGSSNRSR